MFALSMALFRQVATWLCVVLLRNQGIIVTYKYIATVAMATFVTQTVESFCPEQHTSERPN